MFQHHSFIHKQHSSTSGVQSGPWGYGNQLNSTRSQRNVSRVFFYYQLNPMVFFLLLCVYAKTIKKSFSTYEGKHTGAVMG